MVPKKKKKVILSGWIFLQGGPFSTVSTVDGIFFGLDFFAGGSIFHCRRHFFGLNFFCRGAIFHCRRYFYQAALPKTSRHYQAVSSISFRAISISFSRGYPNFLVSDGNTSRHHHLHFLSIRHLLETHAVVKVVKARPFIVQVVSSVSCSRRDPLFLCPEGVFFWYRGALSKTSWQYHRIFYIPCIGRHYRKHPDSTKKFRPSVPSGIF